MTVPEIHLIHLNSMPFFKKNLEILRKAHTRTIAERGCGCRGQRDKGPETPHPFFKEISIVYIGGGGAPHP